MGPPPPPPRGGGGGDSRKCANLRRAIFVPTSRRQRKNTLKEKSTLIVPCGTLLMMTNKKWTPRSLRWTDAERQAKKIQSQNVRQIRWLFWRESQALREEIQKEISEKLIAKREAIE